MCGRFTVTDELYEIQIAVSAQLEYLFSDLGRLHNGDKVDSFATITTDANSSTSAIHDRMPLIVPATSYDDWLSNATDPTELLDDVCVHRVAIQWSRTTNVTPSQATCAPKGRPWRQQRLRPIESNQEPFNTTSLAITLYFQRHNVELGGAARSADSPEAHGRWPEPPQLNINRPQPVSP
jgi:putative SOS response-associated peptidase YedK